MKRIKKLSNNIWVKALLILSIILAILVILGYYRSIVDETEFLRGFDIILLEFSRGLWEILLNSIVLTTICICLALWFTQGFLPQLLSSIGIQEVKGLGIEAKFASSAEQAALISSSQHEGYKLSSESSTVVAQLFSNEMRRYLIDVNETIADIDTHLKIFSEYLSEDKTFPISQVDGDLVEPMLLGSFFGMVNIGRAFIVFSQEPNNQYKILVESKILKYFESSENNS